jgi:hypothetical protein
VSDQFSKQSKAYAAFRPTYPEELYQFIFKHLKNNSVAWDCATGNGQVARYLAKHFEKVYATDISQQQIDHAFQSENILYSVGKAEHTTFPDQIFDLITVGQALHWIDTFSFYNEVRRTAKPEALLAVWGYALLSVNSEIDKIFLEFYYHTVGPYWDVARKLVEEQYANVPFLFEPIVAPPFQLNVCWTPEQFAGYLTSWSATQNYIRANSFDPVPDLMKELMPYWKPGESKPVTFPLFMKLGRV